MDDSACFYVRAVVERLNLEMDGLSTLNPMGRCVMVVLLMRGLLQQKLEWLKNRSTKRRNREGKISMGEMYRFFGFFSTRYQPFGRGNFTPSSSTRLQHARDEPVSLPNDTVL